MIEKEKNRSIIETFLIVFAAMLMALNYALFVFPNTFAPAGVNGLITMVQYLFDISIGYLSFAINVPLLLLAWKKIGQTFAIRSLSFVLSFSVATLFLQMIDLSGIYYYTETGTSTILGPVVAGVFSGYIYGFVLCRNGSTGGMDIVAAWVRSYYPEAELTTVIFYLNVSVAVLSFFVYGCQFEPVIMCALYCFISSFISGKMLRGGKKALKFEVVTDQPEELSERILKELRHGVTVVHAEGMYSKTEKTLMICVVNPHQIVMFQQILCQFPNTFSYVSEVNETLGNFKQIKQCRGKKEERNVFP